MTLRQAVDELGRHLAAVTDLHPTAAQDAALLVLGTLGLERTALYTEPQRRLTGVEQHGIAEALRRRLAGEPIQYILGTQEFYGLSLAVSPAVLIPRPETEILVEEAIRRLPADRPVVVADVGTGSGAIAIAIAVHLPLARVLAIDLSPDALAIAARNAARHAVTDRISFLEGDLLSGVAEGCRPVDAVLSNPPYVPRHEGASLHRQVREFEPHLALFPPGGDGAATQDADDGLGVYRRLVPQAAEALRPGGLLAVEFGAGQQEGVVRLLQGWAEQGVVADLRGMPRVALARSYTPR